jgi:hypothetical protein
MSRAARQCAVLTNARNRAESGCWRTLPMVWLVVALLGVMFTANAMQQATARQEPVPVAPTTQGSTPVTLGAMRGVLFRIFPPIPTELPAEHAVTEPANAGGGSQAKAASAKSSKAASTLSQPQPSYLLGTQSSKKRWPGLRLSLMRPTSTRHGSRPTTTIDGCHRNSRCRR